MTCPSIVRFRFPFNNSEIINLNPEDKSELHLKTAKSLRSLSANSTKNQVALNEHHTRQTNMNNGLSNGHDLSLNFDLTGNISSSNSSNSINNIELSESTNVISFTNQRASSSRACNNFINICEMGMLGPTQKEGIRHQFIYTNNTDNDENKIENGQNQSSYNHNCSLQITDKSKSDSKKILPQKSFSLDEFASSTTSNNSEHSPSTSKTPVSKNLVPKGGDYVVDNFIESNSKLDSRENSHNKQNKSSIDAKNYLVQNCDDLESNHDFDQQYSLRSFELKSDDYFLDEDVQNQPAVSDRKFREYLLIDQNSPSVPEIEPIGTIKELEKNDLVKNQHLLHKNYDELRRRIRRLQIQFSHQNLVKQMRYFVSQQQISNSIKCQRLDLDFSNFISELQDSSFKSGLINDHSKSSLFHSLKNSSHNFKSYVNSTDSSSYFPLVVDNIHHKSQSLATNFLSNSSSNVHSVGNTDRFCFSSDILQKESENHQCPNLKIKIENRHFLEPKISQENLNKVLTTIDSLRYNLRHLEYKYDSDATDSSSGGESCDEIEDSISTTTKSRMSNRISM